MDKEKFEQVLNYFKANNVDLPTDVKNSIEDVFSENDNVETVQCYHFAEVEDFQKDLRLFNEIKLYLDGSNKGRIYNVWTYHGQVNFSLSERTVLLNNQKDEEIIEVITDINNPEVSFVYNAKEYSIILMETVTWETPDNLERHLELMIYCPEDTPEED